MAMMSATICCVLAAYIVVRAAELAGLSTYVLIVVSGLLIVGYIVPRLTAVWIGKSLAEIMG